MHGKSLLYTASEHLLMYGAVQPMIRSNNCLVLGSPLFIFKFCIVVLPWISMHHGVASHDDLPSAPHACRHGSG